MEIDGSEGFQSGQQEALEGRDCSPVNGQVSVNYVHGVEESVNVHGTIPCSCMEGVPD